MAEPGIISGKKLLHANLTRLIRQTGDVLDRDAFNAEFRGHYVDDNFCVKSSIIPAFLRFVRQFCHPAIDAPTLLSVFSFGARSCESGCIPWFRSFLFKIDVETLHAGATYYRPSVPIIG